MRAFRTPRQTYGDAFQTATHAVSFQGVCVKAIAHMESFARAGAPARLWRVPVGEPSTDTDRVRMAASSAAGEKSFMTPAEVWRWLRVPIRSDKSRRDNHLLYLFVGLAVLIACEIFTVMNYLQDRGVVTITTLLMGAGGVFIALAAWRRKYMDLALRATMVLCAACFTYYAARGVNEGFAILWTLVIPLAFSYFVEVRTGIIFSLYFLVLLVVLFYTPLRGYVAASYTETFMTRFPILYAINVALSSLAMIQYHIATLRNRRYDETLESEVRAQTAVAEQRSRRIESMSVELVETLAAAVDAKDRYTIGHARRVADYAALIGRELGLADDEVGDLTKEALLHDVGKISVPDAVLNKPGRLDDEEYETIKSHTVAGFSILGKSEALVGAAAVARWHHERFDGSGYPDGLVGDEIPLHARIVAVADAYDAMCSDRVYRPRLPEQIVRGELLAGRGTQFDPECVNAFMRVAETGLLD